MYVLMTSLFVVILQGNLNIGVIFIRGVTFSTRLRPQEGPYRKLNAGIQGRNTINKVATACLVKST